MSVTIIAIIGFILAGLVVLVGGFMLLQGLRLRLQEKRRPPPPTPPQPRPGRGGTMRLAQSKCYHCGAELRQEALYCSACGAVKVLGQRYKILQRIGQGGMGAVYLVEDNRLRGSRWAMKEMSDEAIPEQLDRTAAIEVFQKEAELLAKLQHPNLPKVIDYLSRGNNHYLIMDYIEGRLLEDLLNERAAPFAEIKVIEWALQLCEVLHYLHCQNPPIIFRDLKPANIMITPTNQVKLIDFGIARLFKAGQAQDTLRLGTPGYAPPEQFGYNQTDARSDIYALGVTMHQLLTKHDPTKTLFNLPPLRKLNAAVSPKLDQIVNRAIQPNPADRFQTALLLKQALVAP